MCNWSKSLMSARKFLLIAFILCCLAFGGCRTGLLAGQEASPPPAPPPAPLVVDGTRTSYADVVAKTSPAVIRIEAEHKPSVQRGGTEGEEDDFFRQFQLPQPRRPQ